MKQFFTRLAAVRKSRRTRQKAPPAPRARPRVEALEDRTLLTTTVYLDFGERFPAAGLTMTVQQLRDTLRGPDLTPGLQNSDTLTFTPLANLVNFDYNGDGLTNAADVADLRSAVVSLVQRYFAPFDVNVVTAAASNLADVTNTLAANNGDAHGRFDAYVFVAGVTNAQPRPIPAGLFGQAGGNDFNLRRNTTDDTAVVFVNNLFSAGNANATAGTALAYTAAHEAGHTFGLAHTNNTIAGSASDLLTQSDIISQFSRPVHRQNLNFFTRFPLMLGDGNTNPANNENPYDTLANDPDIGVRAGSPAYVTGTGAHDQITITHRNATQATVTVAAFADAAHTMPITVPGMTTTTYPYTVNTANGILVEAGLGDDRITVDAAVGGTVTIRGGAGTDLLTVNGTENSELFVVDTDLVEAGPTAINFSECEGLTVNAGGGPDAILVAGTPAGVPVVIDAGDGNDFINVGAGHLDRIRGPLFVNGGGGTDWLAVSDWASTYHRVTAQVGGLYTITDQAVTLRYESGGGFETTVSEVAVNYSGIAILDLSTTNLGDTVQVESTAPGTTTTVYAGGGDDTIDVTGALNLTVYGEAGDDTLNLGTGFLDYLPEVHFFGGPGRDSVFLNDQNNFHANEYTVTANSVGVGFFGGVTFGTPDDFDPPEVLVLNAGNGNDTINVLSTAAGTSTTINAGRGGDTINVGDAANPLDRIRGRLTVHGGGDANDALNLDDRGASNARSYFISNFDVEVAGGAIFYDGVQSLTLRAGNGGNEILVGSTAAGTPVTVYAGDGNDLISVGALYDSLAYIAAPVTVHGEGGTNELDLDDLEEATRVEYNLFDTSIQLNGARLLDYDRVQKLRLDASFGASVRVSSTVANGAVTVNAQGYNDIWLGTADKRLDLLRGTVRVNGQGSDRLILQDDLNPAPHTYHLTATDFTRDGTVLATYSGLADLFLYAGLGDDTISIQSTAAGPPVMVNAGPGNDRVFGGAGRDLLIGGPGTDLLDGGADEDILIDGTTAYDANPTALAAIMAEWTRTDLPYSARVHHLLEGGGYNGSFLLNRSTFTSDGVSNTLTGADGLDLFYGSRARDANDWDGSIGEVFVYPDGIQASTLIDARGLGVSSLLVDGVGHSAVAPFRLTLAPGQHHLQTNGNDVTWFEVAPDGTVAYEPALEGVLSGRGTGTLAVNGRAVQIDARVLGVPALVVDWVSHEAAAPFGVRLLPGQHHLASIGGDTTWFGVAQDGTVDYDPALEGALSGRGTGTLAVNGRAVTLDARALGVSALVVDWVPHDALAPFGVRLLPGQHHLASIGGDTTWFGVAQDGTVDYDPALEGALSGRGTSTLLVNGRAVTLDARVLGVSGLVVDWVPHDAAAPFVVRLLPGQHHLASISGDFTWFGVAPDGTVDYDPSLEGSLTGRGTHTLAVNGRAVQIDARALGVSGLVLDWVPRDTAAPFSVRLLPGMHHFRTSGGEFHWFSVADDGTIDYDHALDGILSGRGTHMLVILSAP
jgi:hypothetical protein